jgi:RNase P/RNase MRP subunit p29
MRSVRDVMIQALIGRSVRVVAGKKYPHGLTGRVSSVEFVGHDNVMVTFSTGPGGATLRSVDHNLAVLEEDKSI